MDLNVLIRGQSNALLFVDRGGAAALERGLEARLGVDVHLLAEWGSDSSTIHSGTAFMSWDTDGQQASLLRYVDELPADLKDNPTATVWMHNEYDQNDSNLTTDAWLAEVRADADLVRGALGQGADSTPYTFVPIRYPYGSNWTPIGDGMAALDADAAFNAEISGAAGSLAMDGDGYPDSSHMGDGDALQLGESLAESMAATLRPLAGGSEPAAPVAEPAAPVAEPPVTAEPLAPTAFSVGSGSDSLVLAISQDAYKGSAQYTVSVDGVQVGGTLTASASASTGQSDIVTVKGDWSAGAHTVSVAFLNDAWDGTSATDRNLHIDGVAFNGVAVDGGEADLMAAGSVDFAFTDGGAMAPAVDPAPAEPAEPAATDWNAIAAQVTAHYNATGSWYM